MERQWNITWDEYKELDYFCRQYDHKKREADAALTLRVSTPQPAVGKLGAEFLPNGSGRVSDPVAMAAERRERFLNDIMLIEKAALLAGNELAPYLLKAVTRKGGTTRVLMSGCPCSQSAFYAMRRRFFFILKSLRENR